MRVHFASRCDRQISVVEAVIASAMLLLLVVACQPQGDVSPQARGGPPAEDQLRAASVAWDEAHNAADVDRLMQLYAETAVSMPYNRPALEGRAVIEADFREFFAAFTAHHKTTIISLEVLDDWSIERGLYELSAIPKGGGAPLTESGKHIVVRRKVDGSWKVQQEIWNTDAPPAQ